MEFERTPGGATFHGLRYECYMVALLYLRSLRCRLDDFHLGSNVKDLGHFDDVILRWDSEGKSRCIFIQMKHRESAGQISLDQLVPSVETKNKDFNLFKYFNSYCIIERTCENSSTLHDSHVLKNVNFQNCEFVLFTNSFVQHRSNNVTELSFWENLINTEGAIFSFGPEDCDVWGARDCGRFRSFLSKLRVFSGQRDVRHLCELVKDEVETCARVQGRAAHSLFTSFIGNIESWWNNESTFLKNLLELRREPNVDKLCNLVVDEVCSYGQHQSQAINRLNSFFYREIKCWGNESSRFLEQLRSISRQNDLNLLCKFVRDVESEESQRFYSSFYNVMESWWKKAKKDRKSPFLSKASPQWYKSLIDQLNTNISEKLKHVHCTFKPDSMRILNKSLAIDECLNVFATDIDCILLCKKVQAELEEDFRGNYLLMDVVDAEYEEQNVRSVCQSGYCRMLVLVAHRNSHLFDNFRSEMCTVVYLSDRELFPERVKCRQVEDSWTFSQLSPQTQKHILRKRVEFQGAHVLLEDICGSEILQTLCGKSLSALLLGENIVLGKPLPSVPELYIPRTMCHQAVLDEKVLTTPHTDDVFAVNNAVEDLEIDKNRLITNSQNCIVHLPCDRSNKSVFDVLCKKYRYKKHVHWVEYQNGFLFWKQSYGSPETPKRFVKHMSSGCGDSSCCSHAAEHLEDWGSRLVLVTGEPGMGKTSLLHSVAREVKRKNCTSWVVSLNPRHFTNNVCKLKVEGITWPVVQDILESAAFAVRSTCLQLERQLLKDSVERSGNITVLLDAVDELSPVYTGQVLSVVRQLLDTKISRLWVTSRMVLQQHLQQQLLSLPLVLQPLTDQDQRMLLSKHIEERTGIVELLLEHTANLRTSGRHICDVPLHSIMIADSVNQILKSKSEISQDVIQHMTLYEIYRRFFELKRKHFYEKRGVDMKILELTGTLEREEDYFMDVHMKCALVAVFTSEEIDTFGLPDFQKDVTGLLKRVSEEKTGIIDGKVNNIPNFIHYTFAEYFAARWIIQSKTEESQAVNLEILFDDKYEFLRRLVDEMFSEGCELHAAVLMGNVELVKQVLDSGIPVDSVDRGGRLALHLAAARCHTEILQLLLSAGSPVSTSDRVLGWSPLRYADRVEHWKAAEQLLQNGADEEDLCVLKSKVQSQPENYILVSFVREGLLNITKIVLDMGCSVTVVNSQGVSPLLAAVFEGNTGMVQELLSRNAAVNAACRMGRTPLYEATYRGHSGVVRELLAHNADVNITHRTGWTPLYVAVCKGDTDVVRELLTHNAAVNVTCRMGRTPLYEAAYRGHSGVVRELLAHNADVNIRHRTGWTPLYVAAYKGHTDVVRELLTHNADVNMTDEHGKTPLYAAADSGRTEIVRELLAHSADVNIPDRNGCSPLHAASHEGYTETVRELLAHNADVELLNNNGHTPLYVAARRGHTETVYELLAHNADVHIPDIDGCTPLHAAASEGHYEVVQFLILSGANMHTEGYNGWTPLISALEGGHLDVAELFLAEEDNWLSLS